MGNKYSPFYWREIHSATHPVLDKGRVLLYYIVNNFWKSARIVEFFLLDI